MHLSAISFLTLLVLSISQVVYANADYGYARVDDKDGYVNLRDAEDLQSAIIEQLPNDTILSANCIDYTNSSNFCIIITDDDQTGFIYKDRLSFFKADNTLVSVPIIKNSPLEATFGNDKYKIRATAKIKPVDIDIAKIESSEPYVEGCPNTYQNICSYGLNEDTDAPDNYYYAFSDLSFSLDNQTITVPDSFFKGIYIPAYAVDTDDVFNRMELYFNPRNNDIYLLSEQSYGALTYSIVFELIQGKYVNRHVWSEAL